LLDLRCYHRPVFLFWNWLLVQSLSPAAVTPLSVLRSHFAVGLFLGSVVFPQRTSLATVKRSVESSPRVPPSSRVLPQQILVSRPQPTDSSLGLSLPTALPESKVHFSQALPARFVPPSGFDYPLGGFLPSIPCRFSFTPAALWGFALRSFLLPNGSRLH
jgi:hypothetical protein